jgi:hypothetical protein
MKRIFLIAGLATAFLLLVVAASAQKANFAGTWLLDKAKSEGLNPRLQGADKVTLSITQDDKTVSMETKVEGGQPPQGGGGAGGGGGTGAGGGGGMGGGRPGGGGGMGGGPQVFKLDGSEDSNTSQNGMKTDKKVSWKDGSLMLTTERAGNIQGTDFKSTQTDTLSLSGDGKTLTIKRHSESTRGGPMDSTMVYNKQ